MVIDIFVAAEMDDIDLRKVLPELFGEPGGCVPKFELVLQNNQELHRSLRITRKIRRQRKEEADPSPGSG
jgi:hypothetical protein